MNLITLGFWVSVALAVLKLLGLGVFATLSWWWIAAPLLLAIGITVAIVAFVWLIAFFAWLIALIVAAVSNW